MLETNEVEKEKENSLKDEQDRKLQFPLIIKETETNKDTGKKRKESK